MEICAIPVEVKCLKTGDYSCNGNLLVIERKTLADFASSIVDKRMHSQVERLRKFPKAALVICGSKKELLEWSKISYNSILGAIAWIASLGITVIKEEDEKDAAYLILKLFERELKVPIVDFKLEQKKKRKPKTLNTPPAQEVK